MLTFPPTFRAAAPALILAITVCVGQSIVRSGTTSADATGHTMLGLTAPNLAVVESAAGTTFPLVRVYHDIGEPVVGSPEERLAASGHALLMSIAPRTRDRDGTPVSLSSIAAGTQDDYFSAQFDALNTLATTPYFIFDHEPSNANQRRSCGDPRNCGPEFVAAWQHLHDLATQRSDMRLVWVWTLTDSMYNTNYDAASTYFPGENYIDIVGVDVYPTACDAKGGSETFASLTKTMLQWHQAYASTTPIMVPEWGAPSSDDSLRSTYYYSRRW